MNNKNNFYQPIKDTFVLYNEKITNGVLSFAPIKLLCETIKYDLHTNEMKSILLLDENQVPFFERFMSEVEVINFDPKPKGKELQFCAIDFTFRVKNIDEVKKYLSLYKFILK